MGCCISSTNTSSGNSGRTNSNQNPLPCSSTDEDRRPSKPGEEEVAMVKEVVLVGTTHSGPAASIILHQQNHSPQKPLQSSSPAPQSETPNNSVHPNPNFSKTKLPEESEPETETFSELTSEINSVCFSAGGGDSLISTTTTLSTKQEEKGDEEAESAMRKPRKPRPPPSVNYTNKTTTANYSSNYLSRGRRQQLYPSERTSPRAAKSSAADTAAVNRRSIGDASLKKASNAQLGATAKVEIKGTGNRVRRILQPLSSGETAATGGRGVNGRGGSTRRKSTGETAGFKPMSGTGVVVKKGGDVPAVDVGKRRGQVEKARVVEVASDDDRSTKHHVGDSSLTNNNVESLENPLVSFECFIFL